MIPYIVTPFGNIPTFILSATFGIVTMFLLVHIRIKESIPNYILEENYIFPKMVISGVIGFFTAGLFDSLFKIQLYGTFQITGITFYGGLIGTTIALYIILKITCKRTNLNPNEWFDLLTLPFIVFHIFGRIGCFLGGCCYGKPTNSFFGVAFPDNEIEKVYHFGQKCYPTQLFEIIALIFILIIIKKNRKFSTYILLYSVARFIIEFFRGDERGVLLNWISPSQCISIVLFFMVVIYKFRFLNIFSKKVKSLDKINFR